MLVLEELEHAKARGAKIYAEIVGYGVSSDAKHITEPDPTGENPARAMKMALRRRGRRPVRDRLHQRARHLDADSATPPRRGCSRSRSARRTRCKTPVSSTKGATGHCLGAAGAVEAIFTTLAVARGEAAADDQLRDARSGVRSRLRPERGARRGRASRRLELVRLRRAQRLPCAEASRALVRGASHGVRPQAWPQAPGALLLESAWLCGSVKIACPERPCLVAGLVA